MFQQQPMKMASAESLCDTETNPDFSILTVGTQNNCDSLTRVIQVPYVLPFLAESRFSGVTLQGVRDRAKVQPGEKVLIVGASGGVGTFAVQIAKAYGAEVTGVCSTAKIDLVRALGVDHVIDYSQGDFAGGEQRYDAILDVGGNSPLSHLRRALTPSGRLVIVGGETNGRWLGGFDRQLRAIALSPLVTQKLGIFGAKENAADLSALRELVASGKVTPAMDRTFPLSEVPAAMRYFQEGNARGKLVITV